MSDMERMIELVKRGDEWASRALTAEQQVEDLSAEVARLREGIADARMYCSRSTFCVTIPPTEGETDHDHA